MNAATLVSDGSAQPSASRRGTPSSARTSRSGPHKGGRWRRERRLRRDARRPLAADRGDGDKHELDRRARRRARSRTLLSCHDRQVPRPGGQQASGGRGRRARPVIALLILVFVDAHDAATPLPGALARAAEEALGRRRQRLDPNRSIGLCRSAGLADAGRAEHAAAVARIAWSDERRTEARLEVLGADGGRDLAATTSPSPTPIRSRSGARARSRARRAGRAREAARLERQAAAPVDIDAAGADGGRRAAPPPPRRAPPLRARCGRGGRLRGRRAPAPASAARSACAGMPAAGSGCGSACRPASARSPARRPPRWISPPPRARAVPSSRPRTNAGSASRCAPTRCLLYQSLSHLSSDDVEPVRRRPPPARRRALRRGPDGR